MTDRDDEAVTVVTSRRVKAGCEAQYEAWLARLIDGASRMPGFIGARVQPPVAGAPREFTSVFRFESVRALRDFEQSDLRRRALIEVLPWVESDAVWSRWTGLELWFAPPAGTVLPQPSRFRMALVMIVVVYGLVLSLGKLVALVFASAPLAARLLLTITIEVFLMTYVLMPRITRWLAPWIYPTKEVA